MMKKFFSALGAGICAVWHWLGHVILLMVKFFFWIWGGILITALVGAIIFVLFSWGIKMLDETRWTDMAAFGIEMKMMQELPEEELLPLMDVQLHDVDFEVMDQQQ